MIERAVMLATEEAITRNETQALLPFPKDSGSETETRCYALLPYMEAKRKAMADFTSAYLRARLRMHAGHITKAAETSGIPRQHFSLLMKRYLKREESGNA